LRSKEVFQIHVITHHSEFKFCGISEVVKFKKNFKFIKLEFSVCAYTILAVLLVNMKGVTA